MGKIINFYREEEFNNKWWHRLVKVLIYGMTLAIFIYAIFWFFDNKSDWGTHNPKYIYSFEPQYEDFFGFSELCQFLPNNNEKLISINCGDIRIRESTLISFLDRYSKSINYKEEFLTKIEITKPSFFSAIKADGTPITSYIEVDYEKLNREIKLGRFDNINAKKIILIGPLVRNILIVILAPLIWFVFIKSVIYRSIIYIVLGNKK